jgi:hypothetical protein
MQHVPGFVTQSEELKAKGVDEILLISGTLSAFLCCLPLYVLKADSTCYLVNGYLTSTWMAT